MIILVSGGGGEVCNSANVCLQDWVCFRSKDGAQDSSSVGGKFRRGQGGEAPGRTALNLLGLNSLQLLEKKRKRENDY